MSPLEPTFPVSEQLVAIAGQQRGDLGQIPFALLLRALAETRRTCVLELRRNALAKQIQFESGVPVQCRSNVLHHTLGRYLQEQGKVTEAECRAALEEAERRGAPIGEVLIEAGLVSGEEVLSSLQRLLAKSLLDAFSWPDGEFEIHERLMEVSAPLQVRVHRLILTGVSRFSPHALIERGVAAIGERRLRWSEARESQLELRLGPVETRLRQLLSEPRSFEELAEGADLDREDVARAVYALATLGVLLPENSPEVEALFTPEADEPVAGQSVEPLEREALATLYLNHRRMSPYELLSAKKDDSTATIERRYFQYTLPLLHWVDGGEVDSEARAKAIDLLLAGARAYASLADPESRERLEDSAEAADGARAGQMVEMLDSERQYQQGLELMESGEYGTAFDKLEAAAETDPQRGLYRAQAAYCKYLKTPEFAEEALRSLIDTHRIDPTCGLAFLYAGEIAGKLERFDEAQELLRQAGKLMAPDRRPIEKLKELKQSMKA